LRGSRVFFGGWAAVAFDGLAIRWPGSVIQLPDVLVVTAPRRQSKSPMTMKR
jgi:hypothetical protein